MVMRYKNTFRLLAMVTAVLAVASVALAEEPIQTTSASALGNKDVGKQETAIGDLFADAARSAMGTQIAFVAASELKPKEPAFDAGKVLSSDLEALISYPDDALAVVELPGKLVRQALERSVSIYPQPNLGFLQVSGLKFSFDSTKPSGSRVTSVTVDGSPLADETTYRVAVSNSLANGALGYWKVWDPEKVRITRDSKSSLGKAIQSYLKANSKIDYGRLNRIEAK